MLKAFVQDIEEVDENLRGFYTKAEDDSGYSLEVDLDSQKEMRKKVKEFRDTNIQMTKQLQELKDKMQPFMDLDPEEVQAALQAQQKVQEAELLPRQDVEKHIASRLESEKAKYEQALAEAQEVASTSQNRLNQLLIERDITEAINKVGQLQKGALGDVLRRARIDIEVKDGQLLEKDTGLNLDTKEWAMKLMKDSPFFFVPNSGISTKGSGSVEVEINPWKSETKNLTEQGKIYKEDPGKAKRLAAEAGVSI